MQIISNGRKIEGTANQIICTLKKQTYDLSRRFSNYQYMKQVSKRNVIWMGKPVAINSPRKFLQELAEFGHIKIIEK